MNREVSRPPEVLENLRRVAARMGAQLSVIAERRSVCQFKFRDGRVCYFLPSSLDINPTGAATLARDKESASAVMAHMGYRVPEGKAFVLRRLAPSDLTKVIDRACRYAVRIGFPVIAKPNSSSRGREVTLAHGKRELRAALGRIFSDDDIALVQRPITGRDYRIVVLDGAIITACERRPLSVTGDGQSTIMELLQNAQTSFERAGRPSRIDLGNRQIKENLRKRGVTLKSVPDHGQSIVLLDTANLMSGGEAVDVTVDLHPSFAKMAINLTRDMGLRLGSVDLIVDGDIREQHPYVVLEINSAPGLDHFLDGSATKAKPVEELYFDIMQSFWK